LGESRACENKQRAKARMAAVVVAEHKGGRDKEKKSKITSITVDAGCRATKTG